MTKSTSSRHWAWSIDQFPILSALLVIRCIKLKIHKCTKYLIPNRICDTKIHQMIMASKINSCSWGSPSKTQRLSLIYKIRKWRVFKTHFSRRRSTDSRTRQQQKDDLSCTKALINKTSSYSHRLRTRWKQCWNYERVSPNHSCPPRRLGTIELVSHQCNPMESQMTILDVLSWQILTNWPPQIKIRSIRIQNRRTLRTKTIRSAKRNKMKMKTNSLIKTSMYNTWRAHS